MTRTALGVDRLVTLLAGIGLVVLGLGAVAWERGALVGGRSVSFDVAHRTAAADWWPWAAGGVGLLLILLGLRWLFAHRPAHRASRVDLGTSDGPDRSPSTADAASVASAAAVSLGRNPAVLKASGAATVEKGTPTVTLTATVLARHGLRAGARAADDTAREVAVMLGDTVAVRTVLRVDAKRRHGTVV